MGVSFQAVSKWETNATTPDIAILPQLALFFCVSIDTLFSMNTEYFGAFFFQYFSFSKAFLLNISSPQNTVVPFLQNCKQIIIPFLQNFNGVVPFLQD
jgi:transcriptional regulator with XRE-family HTH domain